MRTSWVPGLASARFRLALGVFAAIFSSGALGAVHASLPAGAAEPKLPHALPAPEGMSPQARAEIRARMGRHGVTMSGLVQAVILLDRPAIRTLATRIAEEEIVARVSAPTKSGQPLPLPSRFFSELDTLREAAEQLAAAASAQPRAGLQDNDRELADRFAALAKTCVGCHSAYLRGGLDSEPLPPPSGARPQGGANPPPDTPAPRP